MSDLLTIAGITRSFGGLVALQHVSFTVAPGEIFGLIGPNGAGKTTLFNIISGILPPSQGNIFFGETSIAHQRPHYIASLGIARTFQNIRLFKELSALENVAVAHHVLTRSSLWSGLWGSAATRQEETYVLSRSQELLEKVGLADRSEQLAKNFAYADQRRLEIARALALSPQLLLLDEPAAGMNPAEKEQLREFLQNLRRDLNLTMLLIEHHVPLVMGLCDRIAVLNFGELIALGEPASVKQNPDVIAAYLGDI